jgi:hypothetical protein
VPGAYNERSNGYQMNHGYCRCGARILAHGVVAIRSASTESGDSARDIASLPPEAQKQVADPVAFLRARYSTKPGSRRAKRTALADEPFIGMWRDRDEMQDSTAYVRELRKREWEHHE